MEPDATKQALVIMADIYAVEKICREKLTTADDVLAYRKKHSEPLVQIFFDGFINSASEPIYCRQIHSAKH